MCSLLHILCLYCCSQKISWHSIYFEENHFLYSYKVTLSSWYNAFMPTYFPIFEIVIMSIFGMAFRFLFDSPLSTQSDVLGEVFKLVKYLKITWWQIRWIGWLLNDMVWVFGEMIMINQCRDSTLSLCKNQEISRHYSDHFTRIVWRKRRIMLK